MTPDLRRVAAVVLVRVEQILLSRVEAAQAEGTITRSLSARPLPGMCLVF